MNSLTPKILIVDDTPANLVALKALLKRIDAEVIKANSGNEALSLALEHNFALFLLDVQMPEMDGYELSEILLNENTTKDIPIIFLTAAMRDETHRVKGYSYGAIDYIEKPINDVVLLSKVQILMNLWIKQQELNIAIKEIAEKNLELQSEIAERKRTQKLLKKMATYDSLTNLPNRVFLEKESNKILSAAERYKHLVAFLFIDLDGFKAINDNNGHDAGDAVLVEIALRLQEAVRDIDTVARLGGDEFIILLPDCTSKLAVKVIAQRLIDCVNEPIESIQITQKLGASIGISLYPENGNSSSELIKLADKAMYEAKVSGKNQFQFID